MVSKLCIHIFFRFYSLKESALLKSAIADRRSRSDILKQELELKLFKTFPASPPCGQVMVIREYPAYISETLNVLWW